ncbi:hypothetical protein BJ875DRAFT_492069 [Amylocarpus encephaloides]|uniref:C3H1-type domain-containing protein n=1 Tax=Amylocarpus encephaloides TaxID=45428 RepID=A0A9P7YTP2_9HELO|nr:hypothetical protein BJ875DRAFT_492069 [Amylocarpus encephaloides]
MPVFIQARPQLYLEETGSGENITWNEQNANIPVYSGKDCREYSQGKKCPRPHFCPHTHNETARRESKEARKKRNNAKGQAKSREKQQNEYVSGPSTTGRPPSGKVAWKPVQNTRQPLKQPDAADNMTLKVVAPPNPKLPLHKVRNQLQDEHVPKSATAYGPKLNTPSKKQLEKSAQSLQQLKTGICKDFVARRCTRNRCRWSHTAGGPIDKIDSAPTSSLVDVPLKAKKQFLGAEKPSEGLLSTEFKNVADFGNNLDNAEYPPLGMERPKTSSYREQTYSNGARFSSSIEMASNALVHWPSQPRPQQSPISGSVLVDSAAAESIFTQELNLVQAARYNNVSQEEFMRGCNRRTMASIDANELGPINPNVKTTTLGFDSKWDSMNLKSWAEQNLRPVVFHDLMRKHRNYIERGLIPISALTPARAKTTTILAPSAFKLPGEIRILIWKFTSQLEMYSHHVEIVPTTLSDGTIRKRIRALTPRPSMLRVCTESEEQAKKYYKPSFDTQNADRPAALYFNFPMDRIVIRGSGASQLVDFASIAGPEEHCLLRAIAIPIIYWVQGDKDAFLWALSSFRNLKFVAIFVGDGIEDRVFASRVENIQREVKAIWLKRHPKRPAPKVYTEMVSAILARLWGIDNIKY